MNDMETTWVRLKKKGMFHALPEGSLYTLCGQPVADCLYDPPEASSVICKNCKHLEGSPCVEERRLAKEEAESRGEYQAKWWELPPYDQPCPPPMCSGNMTDADPFGNCGHCVNCETPVRTS